MKKLLAVILLFFSLSHAYAQTEFVKKMIKKMYFNKDTSRKPGFVVLPALSSAPETGLEVGGAALVSFYSDTLDRLPMCQIYSATQPSPPRAKPS